MKGFIFTAIAVSSFFSQTALAHSIPQEIGPRQDAAKQCGEGVGPCPSGQCCDKHGMCGTGHAFCAGAGNCNQEYSDACESQQMPVGESLLNMSRPELGTVPYAELIQGCTKPNSIALAFDDGPAHNFTDKILDLFDSYQMKATFFVTGHDFERAINDPKGKYVKTLRRMHAAGHQIGSHTWTHENLTKLTDSQVVNQIHYNEMALRNVLGFIPTYFRPPYLRCEQNCLPVMKRLGYHVIMKNLETKDFDNNDPNRIQESKDLFVAKMNNITSFDGANYAPADQMMYITLNHDIRVQTAYNLTDFMLNYIVTHNLPKSVTVGECLGDPPENWYRKTPTGPTEEMDIEATATVTPKAAKPNATGKGAGASTYGGASWAGSMLALSVAIVVALF